MDSVLTFIHISNRHVTTIRYYYYCASGRTSSRILDEGVHTRHDGARVGAKYMWTVRGIIVQ